MGTMTKPGAAPRGHKVLPYCVLEVLGGGDRRADFCCVYSPLYTVNSIWSVSLKSSCKNTLFNSKTTKHP